MNEFFTSIYSWFCDSSLTVFKMMNNICEDDELLFSSSFPVLGITAAIVSILVAVAFYIWPINHPRFKAWWAWLIMLATNAVINFGLAFAFIHNRIRDIEGNENYDDVVAVLSGDEAETLSISSAQWFDMAFSNACVSILFFIIASLILTWFSSNCRFSPFRK